MDYQKLAELLFADNKLTVEEIEKKYPKRDLPEGAHVTRFAPSPTGFMHIGGFFQAVIDYNIAKRSGGVFYLRIEDTDSKREVTGASAIIMGILQEYGMLPDEYQLKGGVTVGNMGLTIKVSAKKFIRLMQKSLCQKVRLFLVFA